MMIKLKDKSTTLAFVSLKEDGDRDFKFMRNADSDLTFDEIKNNPFLYVGFDCIPQAEEEYEYPPQK